MKTASQAGQNHENTSSGGKLAEEFSGLINVQIKPHDSRRPKHGNPQSVRKLAQDCNAAKTHTVYGKFRRKAAAKTGTQL
jgi:hypothetical protein